MVGTTSLYFNKFEHFGEQNLIADLVIESIAIYGIDVGYLCKKFTSEGYDQLYKEEELAVFDNVTDVAMYVRNVDGFEGEGDFLSKFGLEIRDSMTLSVARRSFESEEKLHKTYQDQEKEMLSSSHLTKNFTQLTL